MRRELGSYVVEGLFTEIFDARCRNKFVDRFNNLIVGKEGAELVHALQAQEAIAVSINDNNNEMLDVIIDHNSSLYKRLEEVKRSIKTSYDRAIKNPKYQKQWALLEKTDDAIRKRQGLPQEALSHSEFLSKLDSRNIAASIIENFSATREGAGSFTMRTPPTISRTIANEKDKEPGSSTHR